MADVVEQEMQDMVPELDDLRRKRIFDDGEIRDIVKRRRDFEYKLRSREVKQEDFLNYVRYEVALECLRARRRKALRWRRRTISDFAGIRRLHWIFHRGCQRFKGDKRMWYQYVDFCLRSGGTKALSKVLMRAMRFHPREVHLWLLAADRELKLGHIKAARSLLLRGLRFAPRSAKLWSEFLRLEVRVALNMRLSRRAAARESGGQQPTKDEGQDDEDGEKPAATLWAPALLLLRRALAALAANATATASFLEQAAACFAEAQKDNGQSVGETDDGFEAWAREVRSAFKGRRPGVFKGEGWAEIPENDCVLLWRLWWSHELRCGVPLTDVATAVAASAPAPALRGCASEFADLAARPASDAGAGDGREAVAEALARLADSPLAPADVDSALAILEALDIWSDDVFAASANSRSTAKKAYRKLLKAAAAAHPSSGRLLILAAAADSKPRASPRGVAAVPIARASRSHSAEEAATMLLLAATPECAMEAGNSGGRVAGSGDAGASERRRVLKALLINLSADSSPVALAESHVAACFGRSGCLEGLPAACDEIHAVVSQHLWNLPDRRVAALAAILDVELRALLASGLAGFARPPLLQRLGTRFEELLASLPDDDPEKEDWFIRYMDFAHFVSECGADSGRRASGVPNATDIQVRALRSVRDQASFSAKAQAFLRQVSGGGG